MRLVFGRGRNRRSVVIPTGSKIGVTEQHVEEMCQILRNGGVRIDVPAPAAMAA